LGDSIAERYDERSLSVRVQERDADFTSIASVDRSGAIHDSDAVLGGESTAWNHEADIAVGQRKRNSCADGRALAWSERAGFPRAQIRSRVSRVCVTRNLPGSDEHFDIRGHESRLVQNDERVECPSHGV